MSDTQVAAPTTPEARMRDALLSIREHCDALPSALAKAIVATCDNGLGQPLTLHPPLPSAAPAEGQQPAERARLQPLTFDALQSVMCLHFGGRELTDEEADSAEAFARAVERAHGITEQPAEPGQESGFIVSEQADPGVMPSEFADYIARNYSGDVVFSDPMWHAVRIWRAAMHALRTATPPAPTQEGQQAVAPSVKRETWEMDDTDRAIVAECRRVVATTDGRKEPQVKALCEWVTAKLRHRATPPAPAAPGKAEAVPRTPRVFIDMDGVIVDFDAYAKSNGLTGDEIKRQPGAYLAMPAIPGAIAAVRSLIGMGYEVWIATKPPTGVPWAYSDKAAWVMRELPELKRRIIVTHDKGMLGGEGDWLIDDRPHKANCESFKGTLIPFVGVTWAEVLDRLRPADGGRPRPVPDTLSAYESWLVASASRAKAPPDLAAELQECREDAERYRWLRSAMNGAGEDQVSAFSCVIEDTAESMDAAIDAMRRKGGAA